MNFLFVSKLPKEEHKRAEQHKKGIYVKQIEAKKLF
jgi:hypothetical protein